MMQVWFLRQRNWVIHRGGEYNAAVAIGGRVREQPQENVLDRIHRTAGESTRRGANSASDEPNPLEQDLKLYEQLARSSPDPQVRGACAKLASLTRYFRSIEPLLAKAAEQLGIPKMCEKLSSEEIAHFIALPGHDKESRLRRMLRENLVEPSLERLKKSPQWNYEKYLTFCCLVFNHALRREYMSRRSQSENRDGRAVRLLLVEEKSRGELIAELGRDVTRGLFFPGEFRWKSEEAPAEAILGICERISEFTKITPVAADPKALQAFMDGALNNIPQQARDHVRTLIDTVVRHDDLVSSTRSSSMGSRRSVSEGFSSLQTEEMRILAETVLNKSRPRDQETKILVEQLLCLPKVRPADKEIVRLHLYEGRTQKETATALGMTQGQVSKRLRVIRGLTKAYQSRTHRES
jgi:RNA polymerase sigma factor (sigma-70 family)